jgi:hypothetical protein
MRQHRQFIAFMTVVMTLSLAAMLLAQQPTPVSGGGKVHITGENPGIRLLDKQGGTILTEVNFWGVDWSPVGSGHVCFVTTGNGRGPNDLRLALYDNPKLVDYVAKETMAKLVTNFNDPPFKPVKATFTNNADSTTERRQVCKSDEYNIELVWRDFNEGTWGEMRPPNGFHMTFFVITSRAAEVFINGKKAAGNWYPSSFPASYLAYAETWRRADAAPASAAAPAPAVNIAGNWNISMDSPGGPVSLRVILRMDGGKFTASIVGQNGETPMRAKLDGKVVTLAFNAPPAFNSVEITMTGTVDGDTIKGTVDYGGQAQSEWSAKRGS